MKFKGVEGGTPSGTPLCRTCHFATYVKGASVSNVRLFCSLLGRPKEIKSEAFECTGYSDNRQPALDHMYKTAWILRTDEFRKSIGFVSPGEWKRKFRQQDEPEEYE